MQKELKKLAKSHPSGSFPQHTSATPAQTDRGPGARTTTPKPAPSNLVGRPLMPTPVVTNVAPPEHTPTDLSQKRGKKRELEESGTGIPPQQNRRQATPPTTSVAGTNGVRPRPIKKQRVVRCPLNSRTNHDVTLAVLEGCPGIDSDKRPSAPATTHAPGNLTLTNSLSFPIVKVAPYITVIMNARVLVSVNPRSVEIRGYMKSGGSR